jgi:hypothetical protein
VAGLPDRPEDGVPSLGGAGGRCKRLYWAKTRSKVSSPRNEYPVQELRSHRADPPFGMAFAFGAWIGVEMTRAPSASKTASKEAVNFVSWSWIRKRGILQALADPRSRSSHAG